MGGGENFVQVIIIHSLKDHAFVDVHQLAPLTCGDGNKIDHIFVVSKLSMHLINTDPSWLDKNILKEQEQMLS